VSPEVVLMSKEFLRILVAAKIAIGVAAVAGPSAASAAAPPPTDKAICVSAYEILDTQTAPIYNPDCPSRSAGMVNC
jgi:hypothetical protein